jgi:hypothetical protein
MEAAPERHGRRRFAMRMLWRVLLAALLLGGITLWLPQAVTPTRAQLVSDQTVVQSPATEDDDVDDDGIANDNDDVNDNDDGIANDNDDVNDNDDGIANDNDDVNDNDDGDVDDDDDDDDDDDGIENTD